MNNNRLYFIREALDLSQKEFAESIGIKRSLYSLYEINYRYMPLKHLLKICNKYNIDIDYIYYISDSNKQNANVLIKLNNNIIAKNLNIIFKENNLSQREVAKILHTSHSTIGSYLRSETTILTPFAIQLAKKYNFSIDWLIGRYTNR